MEICADCGKQIDMHTPSYYRADPSGCGPGKSYHSSCGDPFGAKTAFAAKDAEIARLQSDIARLKQEIEALQAALKPFADIADLVNHTDTRDGECVYRLPRKPAGTGYFTLSREDFRRAKRTLDGGQSPGEAKS